VERPAGHARTAAAQHEGHGVPAGSSAPVVLTGTAHGADGTPLRGAVVRLFHGAGPGRHLMATSVTDATGRFVVRTDGGTYTLEIGHPGHEPHRRR
jgi:protocatechuate 3,4-dioxygenase beta subunit